MEGWYVCLSVYMSVVNQYVYLYVHQNIVY